MLLCPSAPLLPGSLALLLAVYLLRLHTFAPLEVGLDGALSMDLARGPLSESLAFNANDVHPPLFYVALKLWFVLAGSGYFTAKYFVILLSVLATALLAALGQRIVGVRAGLLAGLLLALTPTNVLLGPTVRDYTPGLAASLLTLLLLVAGIQRVGPAGGRGLAGLAVALALSNAVGLLTWYFHFVVLFVCAFGLIRACRRTRWALGGALATGCLIAAPWYVYAVPRLLGKVTTGTTAFGGTPSAPNPVALIGPLAHGLAGIDRSGWPSVASMAVYAALAAAGAGVLLRSASANAGAIPRRLESRATDSEARLHGLSQPATAGFARTLPATLVAGGQDRPRNPEVADAPLGTRQAVDSRWPNNSVGASTRSLPVVGLVAAAVFVYVVVARWYLPADVARYDLVAVPFIAMAQAAGVAWSRGAARWLTLGAFLLLLVWQESSYVRLVIGTPIDWAHDDAVAYVSAHMQPGDAVIFSDRARRLRFDLLPHDGVPALAVHSAGQRYLQRDLPVEAAKVVGQAIAKYRRIWYVESSEPPGTPPLVRRDLAGRAFMVQQQAIGDTSLLLYVVGSPGTAVAPQAQLGELARLTAARFTSAAGPGDPILVDLTWRCRTPSSRPYSVFVHLDDRSGKTVAQHDGEPDDGFRPTPIWKAGDVVTDHHGFLLPAGVAPGTYSLYVGLYQGNVRLTLPNGDNQILLGQVTVR